MSKEAALAEFVKSLSETRAALLCPACKNPFSNPVKYISCLHTVCSAHTGPNGRKFCPVCRANVRSSKTVPDLEIRDMVEAFLQLEALYKVEVCPKPAAPAAIKEPIETTTQAPMQTRKRLTSQTEVPKNTSIEKKNIKGETSLHVACCCLKFEKIQELLEKGANPNTKDNAGWTPLHEVAHKGSLEAVKLLLAHKALSDVPGPDNETPLHEAVRFGHYDIATELVKHGADIKAKNIKGETPLSLADEKMKEALLNACEDIVQTQSENIREISMIQMNSDFENMHVLCNIPYRTVTQKLKKLAKVHGFVIETKFTDNVTHLIVAAEDDNTVISSLEVLQAIVNGLWILNYDWVMKSTDDHLESFDDYEIAGVFTADHGPRKSRFNKYKKLPGLFDGCHFYLHNFQKDYEISKTLILSKVILSKLITDAGGKVLRRVPNPESIPSCENTVPYHAAAGSCLAKCSHYIIFKDIYEPMYNMAHVKALPIGWLLECVQKYELCDP